MNEAITDVALIVAATPAIVFADSKKAEELFAHIEREIDVFKPDLTTVTGRKAIASLAYKVAQTKTAIDGAGADLNEEARKRINVVDAERRRFRERLDALRDRARKPLTDWEAAESQRKKRLDEIMNRIGLSTLIGSSVTSAELSHRLAAVEAEQLPPDVFQDKLEEAEGYKAEAIRSLTNSLERVRQAESDRLELERLRAEQAEREQREAETAAARRAEEARAENERAAEEALRRSAAEEERRIAKAADDARLKAERDAEGVRQKTERQHAEALAKAEREKLAAIEDAARKERAREVEAKRIADEDAARAADQQHRSEVMRTAKEALMDAAGITEDKAKKAVLAIMAGQIPNVTLRFEMSEEKPGLVHIVLPVETALEISNGLSDLALWCHGFNVALGPHDHARRPWGTEAVTDMNIRLKAAIKGPF